MIQDKDVKHAFDCAEDYLSTIKSEFQNKEEIAQLQSEIDDLDDIVEKLEDDITGLQATNEELTFKIAELEEALAEAYLTSEKYDHE